MRLEFDNVVKYTDNELKIKQLEALGFKRVEEPTTEATKDAEANLESLELADLKALADKEGIEYAKNADKNKMLELLEG